MKNFHKIIYTTFLCLTPALLFAGNKERAGQAGASELLINPWARSSGFGGINTSLVRGLEAMNANVGGLAYTKKTEVIFARTNWLKGTDININTFGFSQKVGTSGVLGVSVMAMDFGDIDVTTYDRPEPGIGQFSPQFLNFALAYSKEFSNSIHAGLLVRGITESTASVKAQGVSFDAGIQYATGENDKFKIGIALRNIGPPMVFEGDGLSYDFVNPNNNSNQEGNQKAKSFEIPSLLHIGTSYDFKLAEDHRFTLLANFTSNSYSSDQIGAGGEYAYKTYLMLRAGYNYEKGIERFSTGNSVYNGFATGATVEIPLNARGTTFGIDYSYRMTHVFEGTHAIGARINL